MVLSDLQRRLILLGVILGPSMLGLWLIAPKIPSFKDSPPTTIVSVEALEDGWRRSELTLNQVPTPRVRVVTGEGTYVVADTADGWRAGNEATLRTVSDDSKRLCNEKLCSLILSSE